MIDIHYILSLYIVLDTQLALIHICRTFGVSCDSVKSKLKNQISAWTTADNCKNGGEKCLYKVCITNPLQSYIVLLVVLTEWISQCGANGSVVIGVRPVTQRLLVQVLLWSLDVMCCVLIDIVLVYQAAVGYRLMLGGQLVMDWCPIQGKPMNHPLSSTKEIIDLFVP